MRPCLANVLAISALAGSVGLLACSRAGDESDDAGASLPVAGPGPAASPAEEDLEHLRALGYVDWDAEADADLRGITLHDVSRAQPGYNLYTNNVDEAYLFDLQGRRVHTWRLPGKRQWAHAELLPGGRLAAVCLTQALVLLEWDSEVVWELPGHVHHDVAVAPDGSFFFPYRTKLRAYRGRQMMFDHIGHAAPDGTLFDSWSTFGHLDELRVLHLPSRLDQPPEVTPPDDKAFDYYHLNSVEVLPATPLGARDARFRAGNLLIALRNANLVLILDWKTGSVVWHLDPGGLELPHMPTMLPNGHILVFDNGTHRGFSRVLEIDPVSGETVWTYQGDPLDSFYSRWRGGNQRLANGNTLICESERGHAFEVTSEGELVWEFWNPEIVDGKRKRIYRFTRLSPEWIDPLLERFGDPRTRSR